MKIKQIELVGFKSFSDRTVIPLHNGITCIVGPNGCGKSNVVDAFRWVLGEQSAKSLRGEKMEEVIFQGSSTKKQRGMSEVMLVISLSEPAKKNGNGSPEEASSDEITVSRRLYRSGESEYLLNKRQCRLRDIKDIFLDTGLDVKSYSILDQGRISEIINAKPHDRRFLIEEVAGVMKYKVRKAEAVSKLESSKQNLQRIHDIIYELKRQINSLDRQVKKAEKYKRLMAELKEIELAVACFEHKRMSTILSSLMSDLERVGEIESASRAELSSLENVLQTKRLEAVEREKLLAATEGILQEKERSVSNSEKHIAVLKANVENRKSVIARLIEQQKETETKKSALSEKLEQLNNTEKSIASSLDELTENLREKKDRASDFEAILNDKESEIENNRKNLFRISENLSSKKNELHKLQSSLDTLKYKESSSAKDAETLEKAISALEKAVSENEQIIKVVTDDLSMLGAEKFKLSSDASQQKIEIENKKAMLFQERESLAANISRLNSLKELIIDRSLKDFLGGSPNSDGQNQATGSKGHLVLSDIISTDKDFEIAIEAALSEKINSIIIDNIDDILPAVNIIKEKNLSRTAILYTGFNKNRKQPALSVAGFEGDTLGKASDFMRFENNDAANVVAALTDNMLGNAYIVKNLNSAINILNSLSAQQDITLVTLEGDVISSDGWLFAGHGKAILKRKREIKELQKAIQEQQRKIKETEDELTVISNSLSSKKDTIKTIDERIIDIEKQLSITKHTLNNQTEERLRKKRSLSLMDAEIKTIAQEKKTLDELIFSKNEEINAIEKEKTSLSEDISAMQEAIISDKAEYERTRSNLTDMQLGAASYREKIDAVKKERRNILDTIEELENAAELSINDIKSAEEMIKNSLAELLETEEGIKILVGEADSIRKERADLKEHISSENQELLNIEGKIKNIHSAINTTSQEISDLNLKAMENRIRIENIETSIMQKYGVEIKNETERLSSQPEEFDAPENENRINELNAKIRDLGPVNLGTIEEYEEIKTRYDFLTKQQQDLTLSIAELEEAISRINTTTKRKLREAYELLKAKFSEVFTILFGGGKADILLSDEENILESGIEIIAQPPGKKLQNLNLLSGGEKALTSLAVLFAGFLIKPSPLCILDEADAPLDESNTIRFTKMIKELSNETQFIVITHNRATMEAADYLYGITMEEPGVSKAISLQFSNVEN